LNDFSNIWLMFKPFCDHCFNHSTRHGESVNSVPFTGADWTTKSYRETFYLGAFQPRRLPPHGLYLAHEDIGRVWVWCMGCGLSFSGRGEHGMGLMKRVLLPMSRGPGRSPGSLMFSAFVYEITTYKLMSQITMLQQAC